MIKRIKRIHIPLLIEYILIMAFVAAIVTLVFLIGNLVINPTSFAKSMSDATLGDVMVVGIILIAINSLLGSGNKER